MSLNSKGAQNQENFDYEKEKQVWFDFYTHFNDDNWNHAENAFISNGLIDVPASTLHDANKAWLVEIMEHGVSYDEIVAIMPDAKAYKSDITDEKNKSDDVQWMDWEDGSGSMVSKYGREIFTYDKTTNELRYPDGSWDNYEFDGNWKQKLEDYYHEKIEQQEAKYEQLMQHDIVLPYFNDVKYKCDKAKAEYVALDDKHVMSVSDFTEVVTSMHDAENKHFSDTVAADSKVADMISTAVKRGRVSGDNYICTYEDENHTFAVDSIQNISDVVQELKQNQRKMPDCCQDGPSEDFEMFK